RGEPGDVEYRILRPDGSIRWVRDRSFPIVDSSGHFYRIVGIAEDITSHKQAEEVLTQANRRKDEFLAMLAHELRNPLAPIRTALHILKLSGSDVAKVEQVRELMDRQVRHLARLVDDLLDVSRISRGRIQLQIAKLDLAQLTRTATLDHTALFQSAGLT